MNHPTSRRFFTLALSLFIAIIFMPSCHHHRTVVPSFYYWKTTFQLNPNEKRLLDNTGTKLLYVRFFDVEDSWDGRYFPVVPEGKMEFKQPIPEGAKVIPVVFITNKAMEHLDSSKIGELAAKMRRKINRMCEKNKIAPPTEYQLDCDWTPKSRSNYFKLIEAMKKEVAPAKVSATIRLHQYKYATKTGVPPADRGLLMFYNMGNLKEPDEKNYILDIAEAKKYLTPKANYPLPLDIGLPVYSQGVLYHNNGDGTTYTMLMHAEEVEEDIANGWLKPTKDNWYETSSGKSGTYPHSGIVDIKLRYEKITPEKLLEASNLVRDLVALDTCRLVFFHLDSFQCRNFHADDFNKVVHNF